VERSVYDNMRAVERTHWWFRGRRAILSSQIERLGLAREARILEVGCGTGGNLKMLSAFGRVTGMEPDGPSRAYAEEASGVVVESGFLPGPLPTFQGDFDLIAALDVIEHLDDDQGSIAALAKLLQPSGRILATVPAHAWMWSGHDVAHHHKRRYSKAAFMDLFRDAGLRVVRASYFNALLFAPIALVRLAKLGHGGGDDAVPAGPLNAALASIFGFERRLLQVCDLPFGVSLLVVAEKTG
jgi:SAM-dependent methyltransferase